MKRPHFMALTVIIGAFLLGSACVGGGGAKEATNYPSAGEDVFENTSATIEIEITPEGATVAPNVLGALQAVELHGPARISRGDPLFDDGIAVIPTEIVELNLTGDSPFGPVIVRQSSNHRSTGQVRQQEKGRDFPADSFFDVFVEIEVPDMGITASNDAALSMHATLTGVPPAAGDAYRSANDGPLPIFTSAGRQVGQIVDALHIPQPSPPLTGEPGATATSEASTPIPSVGPTGAEQPRTEGGCEHGVGQSVLFISFTGLQPGQVLTGTVQGVQEAAGGVIGDGTFTVTADAAGNATAEVDINKLGPYQWAAGVSAGTFLVEQECPGPPGSGGATG
ncbi:MAG: DUF6073 family protein [Dehalococcoidia bacterium]